MLGIFLSLLATTLSLLVVDIIFPTVSIANFPAAIIAALMIGLVNSMIKPILNLFSLPINFATLGGFSLVINGFCFWLASVFTPGFVATGWLALIISPVLLSFVNSLLMTYFAEKYPAIAPMDSQSKITSGQQ